MMKVLSYPLIVQPCVDAAKQPEACRAGQQMLTSSEVGVHWALHCYQHTNSQQQVTPVGVLCPEVPLCELLPLLQCNLESFEYSSVSRSHLVAHLLIRRHIEPQDAEGSTREYEHWQIKLYLLEFTDLLVQGRAGPVALCIRLGQLSLELLDLSGECSCLPATWQRASGNSNILCCCIISIWQEMQCSSTHLRKPANLFNVTDSSFTGVGMFRVDTEPLTSTGSPARQCRMMPRRGIA